MNSNAIGNRSKTGLGILTKAQVREIRRSKLIYDEAIKNHSKKGLHERMRVSKHVINGVWIGSTYNDAQYD